eukprot:31349-Pelagococcus_subviridis.AAC.14
MATRGGPRDGNWTPTRSSSALSPSPSRARAASPPGRSTRSHRRLRSVNASAAACTAVSSSLSRGVGGEMRRTKSLRNGVHHADGVVWGPV